MVPCRDRQSGDRHRHFLGRRSSQVFLVKRMQNLQRPLWGQLKCQRFVGQLPHPSPQQQKLPLSHG